MNDAGASAAPLPPTVEDIEVGLLLEGVYRQYGYDFRDYFNRHLQDRVHRLFYQSLVRFGFLALGSKETVRFTGHEAAYEDLGERIYRKVA